MDAVVDPTFPSWMAWSGTGVDEERIFAAVRPGRIAACTAQGS